MLMKNGASSLGALFFYHRLHFSKKLEYLCVLKFCKQKDYGY